MNGNIKNYLLEYKKVINCLLQIWQIVLMDQLCVDGCVCCAPLLLSVIY